MSENPLYKYFNTSVDKAENRAVVEEVSTAVIERLREDEVPLTPCVFDAQWTVPTLSATGAAAIYRRAPSDNALIAYILTRHVAGARQSERKPDAQELTVRPEQMR